LSNFDVWKNADYRVLLTTTKVKRAEQRHKRFEQKGLLHDGMDIENLHYLRETILCADIENAKDIDYTITNNYDEQFEIDLKELCNKIVNS